MPPIPQVGAPPPTPDPQQLTPAELAKKFGGVSSAELAKQFGGTPTTPAPALPEPPPTLPGINVQIPQGFGRSAITTISRDVLPTFGATVGGAYGAAKGGYPGGVSGAGAGSMVGELAGMGLEAVTGAPPSLPEFIQRTSQMAPNAMTAATAEAIGVPIMRGLGGAITKGLRTLTPTKTIARIARESMSPRAFEDLQAVEGLAGPHEVSSSPLLHFFGNIIEGSAFTQQTAANFVASRRALMVRKAEDAILAAGPRADRQAAGEVIKNARIDTAAKDYLTAARDLTARGEEKIAQATAAAGADTTATQQAITAAQEAHAAAQEAYLAASARTAGAIGEVRGALGRPEGVSTVGTRTLSAFAAAEDEAHAQINAVFNPLWARHADTQLDLAPLFAKSQVLEATPLLRATGIGGSANRAVGALTAAAEASTEGAAAGLDAIPGGAFAAGALKGMSAENPARERLLAELSGFAQRAEANGGTLSPQDVHRLRSFYGELGFQKLSGEAAGVFKQLWAAADDVMKQLPPADYAAYHKGLGLHQEMVQVFREGALEALAKKAPEDVLPWFLTGLKKGTTDPTAILFGVDPAVQFGKLDVEAQQAIRGTLWKQLTQTTDLAGRVTERTPEDFLKQVAGLDPDAVRVLFGRSTNSIAEAQQWAKAQGLAAEGVTTAEKGVTAAEQAARKSGSQLVSDMEKQVAKETQAVLGPMEAKIGRLGELDTHNLVVKSLRNADAKQAGTLRAMVGEDGWKSVQSVDLQNLFGRMGDAGAVRTTLPTAKQLQTKLLNRGEKAFVTAHDKAKWDALWVLQRALERFETKGAGGGGKIWIQLITPSAIAGAVGGTVAVLRTAADADTGTKASAGAKGFAGAAIATGAAVYFGPKMLASIFQSPEMRNELLKGVLAKSKNDLPVVARATTQLLTMLIRNGLVEAQGPPGRPTQLSGVDAPVPAGSRGAGPLGQQGAGGTGRGGSTPPIGVGTPPPNVPRSGGSVSPPPTSAAGMAGYFEALGLVPPGSMGQTMRAGTPPPAVRPVATPPPTIRR